MKLDLEAIAEAIQKESPDVLALNEVNRARATNGFVDVLAYLSQRLDMPFIFGANYTDGQYGNALLTRYPIESWKNHHFKTNTTEQRGVLVVTVQKTPEPLTFFATHLDHLDTPDNARAAQVNEMLALWNGRSRSVILGDLNAEPHTPEIQLIDQAGFIDLLEASGQGQVFTFWYVDPQPGQRIDYIFLTPDLPHGEAWAPQTRASDHLPVVGQVGP
jgi:endonuclease/exonuclease/phosphatase family metal-dependent hydrolase